MSGSGNLGFREADVANVSVGSKAGLSHAFRSGPCRLGASHLYANQIIVGVIIRVT